MGRHITPQEARELIAVATSGPWKVDDIAGMILDQNGNRVADIETDGPEITWIEWRRDADHILAAAAPDMAEMIAGARMEHAVARKTDDGVEYRARFHIWVRDSHAAFWSVNDWSLRPDKDAGEYLVTRLVIDLPEGE